MEIVNIGVPGLAREVQDATHSTSPNKAREKIAGLLDAGQVPVEYNFIPGQTDPMIDCVSAGKVYYQIGNDDWDVVYQFQGIMSVETAAVPVGEKMGGSATLDVSGLPTREAA